MNILLLQIWRARKTFTRIELTTLLLEGFGKITIQLGKNWIKNSIFFYTNVKILFFIILIDNLFLPYRLSGLWYEMQKKKKKKKLKREVFYDREIWLCGGVLDLCMSQRLYGKLISSLWCLNISRGDRSPVRRTRKKRWFNNYAY